jgi:hypothetical protein
LHGTASCRPRRDRRHDRAGGVSVARSEVIDNESISFNGFTAFIPCADNGAGELVILDGDLHILISTTINGNNVSGKDHFSRRA